MVFDTKLLEILACPVCKGKLDFDKDAQELICKFDRLAYRRWLSKLPFQSL